MSAGPEFTNPWWELDGGSEAITHAVTAVVGELRSADAGRRNRYRLWDMLYDGDLLVDDVGAGSSDLVRGLMGDTVFNHAARALDMVHAKLTAEVPAVRAVAHGADYDQYLRAQALSRFLVGAFEALRLDVQVPRVAHCALRVGTGCVHITCPDGDAPSIEVFHPRELLVDPDDAVAGDPRVMYRVVPRDRRSVLMRYPDRAADIASAGSATYRDYSASGRPGDWVVGGTQGRVTDTIDVTYAWVLPDEHGEGGREVICLDTGLPLEDNVLSVPRFPVALFRSWDPTVGAGFYGRGLMERLEAGQVEINDTWRHVLGQLRYANPMAFLPDKMDVAEGSLADSDPEGVNIIRTTGEGQIQFVLPTVIGAETLTVLGQAKSDLYTMAGTTEDVAGSQTRSGIDSGIAIRTLHDFQAQAHVDLMKRLGRFVVDLVDRLLDVVRAAHSDPSSQGDWEVRHPAMDVVRWSDVDMDRDQYVLELEQVSPIPDTMSGALQEVEEDAAAGRIDPAYLLRLREQPDRWWADRCNAKEDVDFVDWLVQELLDPGHPMPTLPVDEAPLQLLIDRLRREILASFRLRRPQAVIDRLRDMAGQVAEAVSPPPADTSQMMQGVAGGPPAPTQPPAPQQNTPPPGPVGPQAG